MNRKVVGSIPVQVGSNFRDAFQCPPLTVGVGILEKMSAKPSMSVKIIWIAHFDLWHGLSRSVRDVIPWLYGEPVVWLWGDWRGRAGSCAGVDWKDRQRDNCESLPTTITTDSRLQLQSKWWCGLDMGGWASGGNCEWKDEIMDMKCSASNKK